MKIRQTKIQTTDEGDINIIVSNDFDDDTGTPLFRICVNSYMIGMGGSDGEAIYLDEDEFADFINECKQLLEFVKAGG